MWRQQRIPDDLKRTYRSAFAKMPSQDVAHFISSELPLLREGSSLIQRSLSSIQQREAALLRLKKTVSRLAIVQVEGLQHKLSECVCQVRTISLQTAELLFSLSEQLKPISRDSGFFSIQIMFPWKGRDYLKKMSTDLGFLQRSKISRFMNVGSCADPMLLLPGLKPPNFKEFVIYKGDVQPAPMFVETMLVVPVPYNDIDRLLYATNRITAEHSQASVQSVPTPPARSSAQSSRGGSAGGVVDSSKPILPLRLKVLIQRFQSAPTDEDSMCTRTRAVSEFADGDRSEIEEDRGKGGEVWVAEEVVDALTSETVVETILDLVIDATLRSEFSSQLSLLPFSPPPDTVPLLVTLPSLSEESPLTPYLSEVECFEEELGTLLAVYYQQLPAAVLNITEKAATLVTVMKTATQPCWRWIMDRSHVCGLIGFYLSGTDTVLSHISTLREDWFSVVLPSVCQSFPSGRLFVPLQTWNGNDLDTEKFANPMRNHGFSLVEKTVGGKWAGFKAVYCLEVGQQDREKCEVEVRVNNTSPTGQHELVLIPQIISAFEGYSQRGEGRLKFGLTVPAYEIRTVSGLRYIRLKSSPSASISTQAFPNGYRSISVPDATSEFLFLFIHGRDIGPERKSANFLFDVVGEHPYPDGADTPEAWIPSFQVSETTEGEVDFFCNGEKNPVLPLRTKLDTDVRFPFLFAVLQTTVWKVSRTPLCTVYVTGPKTSS